MTVRIKLKKILPLVILLLVIAVLSIITVMLTDKDHDQTGDATFTEGFTVTDFAVADVVRFEYNYGDTEISLKKNGGKWFAESFIGFEVKGDLVNEMLMSLTSVTAVRQIEGGNLSDYGLDDPSLVVKVSISDGSDRELKVGSKGSYKGYTYMSFEDRVYMFSDTLSSHFNVNVKELLDLEDSFPAVISNGTVMSLTVTDKDGNAVTYTDCDKMTEFLADMKLSFRFHDLAAVNASDNMMLYGFGENCRKIDIFYNAPSDSQPNLLVDANYTLLVGEGSEGSVYYVTGTSTNVYSANADSVNSLFESMFSHKEAHKTECTEETKH